MFDKKISNRILQNKPEGTKTNWCEKYDDIADHVKDIVRNAHKRRAISGLRGKHNSSLKKHESSHDSSRSDPVQNESKH